MEAILSKQPESNWMLLTRSINLYRMTFTRVIGLAFLLSFVVFIPRILSQILGHPLLVDQAIKDPRYLWFILVDIAGMLLFIAIFWRVYAVIHRRHETYKEDFQLALKRVFFAVIATFLQNLLILILTILIVGLFFWLNRTNLLFTLTPTGIIFTLVLFVGQFLLVLYGYTLFIFMVPVIALENKGIFSSIKRSVLLVWNHWWRTFSLQVLPWMTYVFVLIILRYVLQINFNIYFLSSSGVIWATLLQLVLFALFVPWVATVMLVQLHDLELRKKITQKDKNAIH